MYEKLSSFPEGSHKVASVPSALKGGGILGSSNTLVVLLGRLGSKDRLFFERFKMLRKKKIVLEAL